MTKTLTANVTIEDGWYIAQCREVDVVSQDEADQEALINRKEALEPYFEEPTATVLPRIVQIEIELGAA